MEVEYGRPQCFPQAVRRAADWAIDAVGFSDFGAWGSKTATPNVIRPA